MTLLSSHPGLCLASPIPQDSSFPAIIAHLAMTIGLAAVMMWGCAPCHRAQGAWGHKASLGGSTVGIICLVFHCGATAALGDGNPLYALLLMVALAAGRPILWKRWT